MTTSAPGLQPGDSARRSRTVRTADIELFTAMTGDRNPIHYDPDLAARSRFGGIVVQGGVTDRAAERRRRRGPARAGQRVPPRRLAVPGTGTTG